MTLIDLGWDNSLDKELTEYKIDGLTAARVVTQNKDNYMLFYENGKINAKLAGKIRYQAEQRKQLPVVGDWVAIEITDNSSLAIIKGILPRKSSFSRKLPISGGRKIRNGIIVGGTTEEQIIAANIDTVFIVVGLDVNFNIQRLERYVTLAIQSRAKPVIILNKIDCCDDQESTLAKVKNISPAIAVHAVSATKNMGMEVFSQYLLPGKTVVFLGSSGVGKSTLTNSLLGDYLQKTGEISGSNGKGRHTTTSSQLIYHDSGCMIIDTPGLKELQLWCNENALDESFEDVAEIMNSCRFRDCSHKKEPGCAIRTALAEGALSPERFESYKKLYNELQILNGRIKESKKYMSKKEKLFAKNQTKERKIND